MFIPLSIDRVESSKLPYFATNTKIAVMAVVLLSFFFLVIPIIDSTTSLLPVIFLTVLYIIVLYYLARFYMFEENRLKKLVEALDNNKTSTISYFNSVQSITKQGMIKYQYNLAIKYAMVVYVQRGSKVGVPVGFMDNQISIMSDFLRELHKQGYDYDRYEMTKEYEMSEALKHCANKLLTVDGRTKGQFHKLQVESLQRYSEGQSSEIVDYYVIYNTKVSTLKTFHELLEEIVDENFKASTYFSNVKILDREGVTNFFSQVVGLDNFDINNVKRMVEHADMSEFAKVSREFDEFGEEVVEIEGSKEYKTAGRDDIEYLIKREEEKEKERIYRKVEEYVRKQTRELNRFDKNIISFEELKLREYEIFNTLFEDEDTHLLGEEMNNAYKNWKAHKKMLEMESDDEGVIDLDFEEDTKDGRDDYIINDNEDTQLRYEATQIEDALDIEGLEDDEFLDEDSDEVIGLEDLDSEDDIDEDDIFDDDDYEVGYGFYENRMKDKNE